MRNASYRAGYEAGYQVGWKITRHMNRIRPEIEMAVECLGTLIQLPEATRVPGLLEKAKQALAKLRRLSTGPKHKTRLLDGGGPRPDIHVPETAQK